VLAAGLFLFFPLLALVGVFMLVVFGFWILAIVDAARQSALLWQASEQSQVAWILIVIFLHFLGAILYFAIARPKLKQAQKLIR